MRLLSSDSLFMTDTPGYFRVIYSGIMPYANSLDAGFDLAYRHRYNPPRFSSVLGE